MSHSLNLLKGDSIRSCIGDYMGGIKKKTRSLTMAHMKSMECKGNKRTPQAYHSRAQVFAWLPTLARVHKQ